MRKTIWKYKAPTSHQPVIVIDMPAKAEITGAAYDPEGVLSMWAIVDPNCPTTPRRFQLVGTGHTIEGNVRHIGSVNEGVFVWHILELLA